MYEKYVDDKVTLGPWTSFSIKSDPKHLSFVLSRYKFCSKILQNKKTVLEVGCGDAFGIHILAQGKEKVYGIDNDDVIYDNVSRYVPENITFRRHDILSSNLHGELFDSAVSIDVIEHIDPSKENVFMKNIVESVSSKGIVIIGTPNITSEKYASPQSKEYHINLYDQDRLNNLMLSYFDNVLNFGMNDEVVHTGFGPMSHYLFSVGIGLK